MKTEMKVKVFKLGAPSDRSTDDYDYLEEKINGWLEFQKNVEISDINTIGEKAIIVTYKRVITTRD